MYYILKKGVLKKFIDNALIKAKTMRNLAKELQIPRSTLSDYRMEKRSIKNKNLNKILDFTNLNLKQAHITQILSETFKQEIGGKNSVKIKKEKGVFEEQLKLCHQKSSTYMKEWHKKMKKENPESYYKQQYEKFKLVGNYKLETKKGEKVRNKLEKDIADILYSMDLKYEYEPLVKANKKYFFPDFLINNKIIIECTMWRGTDKAIKLKEKIKYLKNKYKVFVIIPKHLNNYYQILDSNLIKGLDEFVPVAQTFRDLK